MENPNQDELEFIHSHYCNPPTKDSEDSTQLLLSSLPFTDYAFYLDISAGKTEPILHLSEYFTEEEWNQLDGVDQRNFIDAQLLEWAETRVNTYWEYHGIN